MTSRTLTRYLKKFSQAKIVVVGDLILDQYIWGSVHRISPEAPVPVLHVDSESWGLGGAANVYQNIRSLGGGAWLCGVIGKDENGKSLLTQLKHHQSGKEGIVCDAERPTTKKTRVVAHHQQIVRFDVEARTPLSQAMNKRLLRHLAGHLSEATCVIISDYAKGVVSSSLMVGIRQLLAEQTIPIIVDPKVEHMSYYTDVTVITPNHWEASQAARLLSGGNPSVKDAGPLLRQTLGCEAVLITRGEQGMSLYDGKGEGWHVPTLARQVYDVTGAGDTVVSALALAMSAGATMREAAMIANQAAGLVVGMVGTGSVTQSQLRQAFCHGQ